MTPTAARNARMNTFHTAMVPGERDRSTRVRALSTSDPGKSAAGPPAVAIGVMSTAGHAQSTRPARHDPERNTEGHIAQVMTFHLDSRCGDV